jgi:NitT/TauT family transport system substrate-binding protein
MGLEVRLRVRVRHPQDFGPEQSHGKVRIDMIPRGADMPGDDHQIRLHETAGTQASCCGDLNPPEASGSPLVPRRRFLAQLTGLGLSTAEFLWLQGPAQAQERRKVRLAFCSQLLCIIPYEVTRQQGYFREAGLDVELVYMRGGTAAVQALLGGAVDYAATSFDVALAAFGRGADIVRFFTTGRLPLFALVIAPRATGEIRTLAGLKGRTVGISALGNADHLLLMYLLRKAGVKPETVQYAVLGPNMFEALRFGHVDAGMVQEPGSTLVEQAGGKVLVNLMDLQQARQYLGGLYEFMGVAVRRGDWNDRLQEMQALSRALTRGLRFVHYGTTRLILDALPKELIAGGDRALLEQVLAHNRQSLYPVDGRIDLGAVRRVAEIQRQGGVLAPEVDTTRLITNAVVDSL